MSKLEELIAKLCPNGVEYKKIGDIADYEQPTKYIVKSTKYDDSFTTPVLTAGQSFILGYTDELDNIYLASKDNPVIIFDDFTGAIQWVDFPFKVKSSAMKMITANSNVLIRYLYHWMALLGFSSSEHKRLWISTYSNFEIPVPPLDVQAEIVQILDTFTELTENLTAELTARSKQYEYYRDTLLTFDDNNPLHSLISRYCPNGVEYKALSEVSDMKRGTTVTKKSVNPGDIPVISGGREPAYYCDTSNRNGETITVAGSGAGAGFVQYWDKPIFVCDAFSVKGIDDLTSTKFLYYVLLSKQEAIYATKKGGGVPHVHISSIKDFEIPVPPLEVQRQIVQILDRFDALCNDLTQGLPAEIEARRKQYEYYRDQLLTFNRA